mmetsp:Transcript_53110/g.110779  ORF Transcript_53110/g.110779 Transcript_53110/m.110779 type:complete len:98 (-) Transcript_53110:1235-1528(-)
MWQLFAAVTCKQAGSRRWRRGKGGRFNHLPLPPPSPPRRCKALSVLCRVVAAAEAEAAAAAAEAVAARSHSDPDLESNGGERSGGGPLRGDWDGGYK